MKRSPAALIMLAPALLIIVFLFFGGFLFGLLQSFSYLPSAGLSQPGFEAYTAVFGDGQFAGSFLLTLWIAASSTVLTVVFAVATALFLRRRSSGRSAVTFFYQFPITVPHIIIALSTLFLFNQSGLFARLCYAAGLITDQSQFPQLVNDRLGLGIIYVYVWKQVPFAGVIIMAVLKSAGCAYEEAARTLGAGPFQRIRYVLLPLVLPGILPASIICFAYTFGSFEVPFLLGRPYPAMLPVLAFRLYANAELSSRPRALALAVFITLFLMFFVVLYKITLKRIAGRAE